MRSRTYSALIAFAVLLIAAPTSWAGSVNSDAAAGSLPPTGLTLGGPGTFIGTLVVGSGGFPFTARVWDAGPLEVDVCITVTNTSHYFIEVFEEGEDDPPNPDVDPGDTRTYCFSDPASLFLRCVDEAPPTSSSGPTAVGQCSGHWRVDQLEN